MTCLELKGVSKRYDGAVQDALHALDLEIEEGEILGVVGASGSGKTTLLRLVAGLESPTTGELRIGGLKVAGGGAWVPPEKRGVGLVFQEGALFPHMTVEANVAYGLRGLSKEERMARLHYLLAMVNLRAAALRYPHELSGGERQRIALARALAPNPKMVLLDEPFSNLDPNLRTYLRDQLLAIIRKVNATALVVTHDTQDALVISDRLAILRDGQLVQHGPSRDVYHTPNDAYCARLFGPANALPEAWSGKFWRRTGWCLIKPGRGLPAGAWGAASLRYVLRGLFGLLVRLARVQHHTPCHAATTARMADRRSENDGAQQIRAGAG